MLNRWTTKSQVENALKLLGANPGELADALDIPKSTVLQWLNGKSQCCLPAKTFDLAIEALKAGVSGQTINVSEVIEHLPDNVDVRELSERLGYSHGAIYHWLSGRRQLMHSKAVSMALARLLENANRRAQND